MQLPIVTSFIIRLARPRECKWDWIASISRGNLSCCIKVTIHQGPILPECIQQGNPEMDSIRSSSNGACEVAWEIQHRIFSAFECFNLSEQFCCVTKKKNGCCRPVSKMIEVKWFCAYCIKASCLRVRKQQSQKLIWSDILCTQCSNLELSLSESWTPHQLVGQILDSSYESYKRLIGFSDKMKQYSNFFSILFQWKKFWG